MNAVIQSLTKKLGPPRSKGSGEFAFRCPKHPDREYRLGVNIKKQKFNCFRCGWGQGERKLDALFAYLDIVKPIAETLEVPLQQGVGTVGERWPCPLPEGSRPLKYPLPGDIQRWFAGRRQGRGFVYDSNLGWFYRGIDVIIPVIEGGIRRCWISKNSQGFNDCTPRAIAQKSFYLWGLDELTDQPVYVVEGVFDALQLRRLGLEAVALMGSAISDTQVGKLVARRPPKIFVMMDGDQAGYAAAPKVWSKITKRYPWTKVQTISLPKGMDPDDLDSIDQVGG